MISLSELLQILPEARGLRIEDVSVSDVTDDSREVHEGSVFVAVRGTSRDGHDFLAEVMAKKPAAIIAERKRPAEFAGLWIQVADTRPVLGKLAAQLAGQPGAALAAIGVTGTNGKTTVTYFIHALLEKAMIKSGLIGTIKVNDGRGMRDATHTTPGALEMQRILQTMKENGCRAVVMETSSHGLEQGRCAGIPFQVGVFLNLTQDHLDYHGTMEDYLEAKKVLFRQMIADGGNGVAVINQDDAAGEKLIAELQGQLQVLSFGFSAGADFRASEVRHSPRGQVFTLDYKGRSYLVRLPVVGRFNVLNALAALAAGVALGLSIRDLVKSLETMKQTPGRMELVGGDRLSVFVDYAHTPDAIEKACETLRALHPNRLITVFGCGGNRDRTKRPLMAAAAAKHSHYVIVTSDNPRFEEPAAIIEEVLPGLGSLPHGVIEDRREAIMEAIDQARPGDFILIAGKGHETYQEIKGQRFPFDDRDMARQALEKRKKREQAEFEKRAEERELRAQKRERNQTDEK